LSKIGIKPDSKVVDKGIVRTQKILDELRRDFNTLKARVDHIYTSLGALLD
jgi:RNA processing factor Prp31